MSASRSCLAGPMLLLLGLAFPAFADQSPRAHDGGFFLRLSAGGGGASSSIDAPAGEFEVSGGQGDVNFAIGAIVSPNLALHGTLFGWSIDDPEVEVAGTPLGEANAEFTMSAFGIGMTYYLMPTNLYVSGSVGLGTLSVDAGSLEGDSETGLAVDLTLGKEWWVGDSWGLGAAIGVGLHAIPDGSIDEDWSGGSIAIRFTATYN